MMKNSTLLKWANNKNSGKFASSGKHRNKNWIHPPDALVKGHVAYFVKFLGSTEVDQPKGIEIVKEGIRKLKFNQELRKAEGNKIPKVELTVSIDGVAIHEPKTKKNLHQYPLHRISYCADDKAEKRFFSFIAKEGDSDKHTCFVFVSDKLAEEITLTIGQAFDLAYRRFLETSGRELDLRRQVIALQKQLLQVKDENSTLKTRITQLSALKNRDDVESYMKEHNISDLLTLNGESSTDSLSSPPSPVALIDPLDDVPPVPPRNISKSPAGHCVTENILTAPAMSSDSDDDFDPRADEKPTVSKVDSKFDVIEDNVADDNDEDFDPRAEERKQGLYKPDMNGVPISPPLLPPPCPPRLLDQQHQNGNNGNRFGSQVEPFGSVPQSPLNNTDILAQLDEMKAGFSRGLSFGSADDDFTLESLDPLRN